MENINTPRDQIIGQMQSQLQFLRQALLSSQAEMQQLAKENAALKQQMVSKELALLTTAEFNQAVLEQKLRRELYELHCKMYQQVKEKEDEVSSITLQKQELLDKMKDWEKQYDDLKEHSKRENEKVVKSCEDKIAELTITYDQKVTDLNSEWQRRLLEKENVIAELKDEAKEVSEENTDLRAAIREKVVIMEEFMAKFSEKEPSEKTKWKRKCQNLQKQLEEEKKSKRVYLVVAQEIQKDHHRLEEQWHLKVKLMEEKIELLTKENSDLELFKKSQEAAKKRRKEMKALRRAEREEREEKEKEDEGKDEKQLKRERKEREKKEKKEKKEREKAEKERLKQEQKDQKEREKREKKERKERERRNR